VSSILEECHTSRCRGLSCLRFRYRDQPVHLYDAYTGAVRATYRPFNRLDEMESPTSVCFANNGMSVVVGGFRTDRMLQLFDLNRPGRDASVILKLGKTRRSTDGQKGLVSALAVASVESNLLAVGTYSPGSIYLYDLRVQFAPVAEIIIDGACVVGHGKSARKRKHLVDDAFSTAKTRWYHSRTRGGVTQVKFTADSQSLLSLSRRSNTVLQWDVRRLSSSYAFCAGVASYETRNNTNQRLEFTLDGNEKLYIGGQDRCVRVYDLKQCVLLDTIDCVFGDSVNGVSVHQLAGQTLMATTTGSRHFPSDSEWDLDFPHGAVKDKVVGCVCLSELS
jgi:telomerase Cajal body protein 1